MKQHPEEGQVRLLQGDDLTMLERCRKRLEEAWYLYHCSKLSREVLRDVHWRLTQEKPELCIFLVIRFHRMSTAKCIRIRMVEPGFC